MPPLFAFVAGLVAFWLLALAGIGHALHPRRTVSDLMEHRLWPRHGAPMVYAMLIVAELTVGAAGIAIVLRASAWHAGAIHTGAVVLYLIFTFYALILLRWRPQAPCGCSTQRRAVSVWTIARSAILALVASLPLASAGPAVGIVEEPRQLVIGLLAGSAFTVMIWRLPDAMPDPDSELRLS